ncbi:MAG: hypothetical protein K2M31_07890, partial [Muribaculaceae bacterium]|nr:hypothetical protein [Muribaculaceae bacterium]
PRNASRCPPKQIEVTFVLGVKITIGRGRFERRAPLPTRPGITGQPAKRRCQCRLSEAICLKLRLKHQEMKDLGGLYVIARLRPAITAVDILCLISYRLAARRAQHQRS